MNYIEKVLILASTVTSCISIYAFPSFYGIPIEITRLATGLKVYAIPEGIKRYNSIIKKKKIKHDKIILLEKSKQNRIKVLPSQTLIGSIISHDELF